MKRILLSVCLLLAQAEYAAASEGADKYQALLSAARQGTAPVDWQALRFAYADSPAFDLTDDGTQAARRAMIEAVNKGDFAGALAKATVIIDKVYVDLDAHWVAALANKELGNAAAGHKEHDIALGIIKSIMTGDGLTAQTAFTVIDVHEEYALLHALAITVTRQALVTTGGHSYDVMSTTSRDGKAQDYYFLIDRVLAAEARSLTQP
jgi:hypothetical protein